MPSLRLNPAFNPSEEDHNNTLFINERQACLYAWGVRWPSFRVTSFASFNSVISIPRALLLHSPESRDLRQRLLLNQLFSPPSCVYGGSCSGELIARQHYHPCLLPTFFSSLLKQSVFTNGERTRRGCLELYQRSNGRRQWRQCLESSKEKCCLYCHPCASYVLSHISTQVGLFASFDLIVRHSLTLRLEPTIPATTCTPTYDYPWSPG